jgi:hypothetical protein
MVYKYYHGVIRERFGKFTLLTIALLFAFAGAVGVLSYASGATNAWPSTNKQNEANGNPYVESEATNNSITLTFISDKNFCVLFEYRVDGADSPYINMPPWNSNHPIVDSDGNYRYDASNPDWDQGWTGDAYYNTFGIDPSGKNCGYAPTDTRVSSETTRELTLPAEKKVEIRLALGAERDFDFDWTEFKTLPGYEYNESHSEFRTNNKYIRRNNDKDVAAQVRVPGQAEKVRFNYVGEISHEQVEGYEHVQLGQWPRANGDQEWRGTISTSAGEYDVTAEYLVSGTWHPVTGTAKLYALGQPVASYVLPNSDRNVFRGTDNPVRIRVEDKFEQFDRLSINVGGRDYLVPRSSCDDRQSGNYLLCDLSKSTSWGGLAEGEYTTVSKVWTKANSRLDNLTSSTFTVDSTQPTISELESADFAAKQVKVSTKASDNLEVESVLFYLTEPRADGVCDGNGNKLAEARVPQPTDGVYSASLNSSALQDGSYCVNAMARDTANNNSAIARKKITIDNTQPTHTINSHSSGDFVNGTFKLEGRAADNLSGIEKVTVQINRINEVGGSFDSVAQARQEATYNDGEWSFEVESTQFDDGVYRFSVNSVDAAGNKRFAPSIDLIIDNTPPVVVFRAEYQSVPGKILLELDATVTDENGIKSLLWEEVEDSKPGGATVTFTEKNSMPTRVTVTEFGVYTFKLTAVDEAGNPGYGTIEVEFKEKSVEDFVENPAGGRENQPSREPQLPPQSQALDNASQQAGLAGAPPFQVQGSASSDEDDSAVLALDTGDNRGVSSSLRTGDGNRVAGLTTNSIDISPFGISWSAIWWVVSLTSIFGMLTLLLARQKVEQED